MASASTARRTAAPSRARRTVPAPAPEPTAAAPITDPKLATVTKFILERTQAFNKGAFIPEKKMEELTPLSQRTLKAFHKSDFGCQRNNVLRILSVIVDEDLTAFRKGEDDDVIPTDMWKKGVIVVPTDNHNGHDYELNMPAMIVRDGDHHALKHTGTRGNNIAYTRTTLRPATDTEVADFVAKNLDTVMSQLGILLI